ncbi:hypothetical protein AA313_de0210075 [Arthrobotrys entomopaga]|nr:hypothetical protein AA313_de0210075 [Arthrobotrys entomopaga]
MTDILENLTDNPLLNPLHNITLLSQQQILNLPHPVSCKMVPGTGVSVQHRRSFNVLLPIRFTPLALERIVRITPRITIILEQLSQIFRSKMSFHVLRFVNHARREGLFVGLTLEYFFFNSAGCDEAVHKT